MSQIVTGPANQLQTIFVSQIVTGPGLQFPCQRIIYRMLALVNQSQTI